MTRAERIAQLHIHIARIATAADFIGLAANTIKASCFAVRDIRADARANDAEWLEMARDEIKEVDRSLVCVRNAMIDSANAATAMAEGGDDGR